MGKIGGKGKNLHILSKNGFTIPEWFIVTTDVYKNFIETNNVKQQIEIIIKNIDFKDNKSVSNGSKKIKEIFLKNKIPKDDLDHLLEQYKSFRKQYKAEYLAIRSSAIGEDDFKTSFAGQMDSFLFISKPESYMESIKKCWASAFSERALTYRYISKLPLTDISIAVIVQKMIFGDISGVMFTVNPINNNMDEVLINSTYGIGEGIVSGELDTDNFVVNKKNRQINQEIFEKEHKIVFNGTKREGTKSIKVEKEKQNKPSLTEKDIKNLFNLGNKVESLYGLPQDIEWTIKDNKIYLLQTRPITTITSEESDYEIIWDNSNIIESFPGMTKPLTFSVARMAWSSVFRQTAESLGVSPDIMKKNEQIFDNMLGLIHGRVYYNLMSWYKLTSFFPGYKQNQRYMEQMMGVKESYDYKDKDSGAILREKIFGNLKQLPLYYSIVKNYLTIDKDVERFITNFERYYNELDNSGLAEMEPWQVMGIYHKIKTNLLDDWKVDGINNYSAMFFYGLVKSLTIKYDLDLSGSLQNDLFCGEENMVSTEPTKKLLVLTQEIKKDKKLESFFIKKDEKTILKEIKKPEFSSFNKKFTDYLDKYGFRCMNELKLEENTLKDDPSFVIQIAKNYLGLKDFNLDEMNRKELEKRWNAEKTVKDKLRWHLFRKLFFNWALRNARKNVRNRENMRFCRTRIFGLLREAVRSIARSFARDGIIEKPEDIFYLEIDEIFDFIKGTSNNIDLKILIDSRKKAYGRFEKETIPTRFVTNGVVNTQDIVEKIGDIESKDNMLNGVSCCPGIVKGKARVILSPKDNVKLNGEILVAERTDPGWVPLYPSASGLLIERGSVLSHSAIVARELGLPTIVGVKNISKIVKDGQIIKMDAGKGVVYLKPEK